MPHTLPHDPVLPQLTTALDAAAMRGIFKEILLRGSNSSRLELECSLYRFRYRKARRAIMLHELELSDRKSGWWQKNWVSGSIQKDGKAQKLANEFARTAPANGKGGTDAILPGFSYIPDLEMFVQCFPVDRPMPELTQIMRHGDPAVIALLMRQFGKGDWSVARQDIEPVRYRPGVGATMRATIGARNKTNDTLETHCAYIKTYRSTDPAAAFYSLTALSQAAARSGSAFAVPAPIGYSQATGALAIAPAPGARIWLRGAQGRAVFIAAS